ncbi:hypothetical protein B0H14DRAFT_2649551 [Mycena olivaceomarginata]|nr:hypothetical protein B0H14DRAFT_2649551 [Mycena olivaceomarginata]
MSKKHRPKIKLFSVDQEDVKPGKHHPSLRPIRGPPSLIVSDLPGPYTNAERRARGLLIQKQRTQLVKEAGFTRMLGQISLLNELNNGALARAHARENRLAAARKAARDEARRLQIDIRCRLAREERLRNHPLPPPSLPPGNRTRPVPKQGKRAQRAQPLSEDDLYVGDVRPLSIPNPSILHACILCFNAKSHPVLLKCGHSSCYICIRLLLETDWCCPYPSCGTEITCKPVAHDVEAAAIERVHPNWDQSSVAYSWDGLWFPWANRISRSEIVST